MTVMVIMLAIIAVITNIFANRLHTSKEIDLRVKIVIPIYSPYFVFLLLLDIAMMIHTVFLVFDPGVFSLILSKQKTKINKYKRVSIFQWLFLLKKYVPSEEILIDFFLHYLLLVDYEL